MKNRFFWIAGVILVLASCSKEPDKPTSPNATTFRDLEVPSNFKFQTDKQISLQVDVQNPGFTSEFKINVYDFNPVAGGGLIYSGFTSNDQLSTQLNVPSVLNKLFLQKFNPDGSSELTTVELQGNAATYSFKGKKQATGKGKTTVVSPNCSSGCSQTINNSGSNLNINSNDPGGVYCLTGSFTGNNINVNRSGVTIRICGNANVNNLSLNNGSSLEVTDGATLTVNNLNLNQSSGSITFYDATINITNNFSPNGSVTNHGSITADKSININGNATLINNGDITVDDDFNNNKNLTNNGSIVVGDRTNFNGSSVTINNCKFITGDEMNINSTVDNHGYIEAGADIKFNGGSAVTQHNGAMIWGKDDSHINAGINGNGTTSLLKIDNDVNINGGGSLNGALQLCAGSVNISGGSINQPAVQACSVYIPAGSCIPGGNGTPTVVDTDNDGVADELDLFPNDAERAGELFYPNSAVYGTLAFEDLWPTQGDYDFNDLVLDYRIRLITNANNDVKDVEYAHSVRAIGATFRNGFGFELEVPASAVSSVTRSDAIGSGINLNANGTESGQTNAVIIVFDNAFDELPNPGAATVNTISGNPYAIPDSNTVVITFTNAQSLASLGTFPYNPFIYIDQDRGREVHLSGESPTDLANTSVFGTGEDVTNVSAGVTYVNSNNLPWAINIMGKFDYPKEKNDIVNSYLNFETWAESGGTNLNDWYLDLAGYRNSATIY